MFYNVLESWLERVYEYIKTNILAHKEAGDYIADEYVKGGYGQVTGGYFVNANKPEYDHVIVFPEKEEPNQKRHLIDSYYNEKIKNGFDMQKPASLGRIMCPQLMLWIAEIAGLERHILIDAKLVAIDYEKKHNTKIRARLKTYKKTFTLVRNYSNY